MWGGYGKKAGDSAAQGRTDPVAHGGVHGHAIRDRFFYSRNTAVHGGPLPFGATRPMKKRWPILQEGHGMG